LKEGIDNSISLRMSLRFVLFVFCLHFVVIFVIIRAISPKLQKYNIFLKYAQKKRLTMNVNRF